VNLQVGQVISNYKELCEIFGLKYSKGSKNRKYHLREVERYCTYHKEGNRYIIDQVYETPLEAIDNRKNNGGHVANTKYDDLMDRLVINTLHSRKDERKIDISFSQLFYNDIPILNEDLNDIYSIGHENFAGKLGISKGLVLKYTEKLNKIVKKSLEISLNRLEKQGLINWSKNIMVIYPNSIQSIADEKLVQEIKDAEIEVYKEMDISHFHRTNNNINRKFKRRVYKLLSEDISTYFNVYSIEILDENIEKVESDIDELIRRFIDSLHLSLRKYKIGINNPYSSYRNQLATEKLDRYIWNLPEGYISENEFSELISANNPEVCVATEMLYRGEENIPF